jgi:hypothetical protein
MCEAMDLLHANIGEIEKTVFFNTANLFNLEVDLIFYDTTTASFHVGKGLKSVDTRRKSPPGAKPAPV